MSRIGRMPITVPAGVEVTIAENNVVTVKGPKGTLTQALRPEMILEQEGNVIHVKRPSDDKLHCALHGMTRALLHNMVVGVSEGFKKELEVNGTLIRSSFLRSTASPLMSPLRTRSSSPVPISRRWASLRRKSVKSVLPSLIRARASSMSMKSSAARSVRPAPRSKEVCRND